MFDNQRPLILTFDITMLYSPVAQLVEQVAVNHLVGGSSPSRGANKRKGLSQTWFSPLLIFVNTQFDWLTKILMV